MAEGTQISDSLEVAAIAVATRLKTPLQIEQHLKLALEEGTTLRKASYSGNCGVHFVEGHE